MASEASARAAARFVEFVNEAVTPFHAVRLMASKLAAAGYVELKEADSWPQLHQGGKFYVTRNESSIVAFAVGGRYAPGNGIKIVGAHTDSPNFAIKPNSKLRRNGFAQIGVQTYGGGLWHTWFDRDLTVAGRVLVNIEGKVSSRLVQVPKPVLRIPNLAIHLTTAKEREQGFCPNKEDHLTPVSATEGALGAEVPTPEGQCPLLFDLLGKELGVPAEAIVDFDLSLIDTQPAAVGGAREEFVFAPRIDNLLSCHCALDALLGRGDSLETDEMVRMVACFDHEEVGSSSSPGAGGSLIPDIVDRLQGPSLDTRSRAVAKSFLLSVDGAHALHPNYAAKHEQNHRPMLHRGPVIKYNANQRYATSGETAAIVSMIAKRVGVPIQKFCVKNDSPCGSTIGPVMSSLTGIRGVDVGNAMLSMHSIREMCGTADIQHLADLIAGFFEHFGEFNQ
uniref:aspartyl aminopeptidase n=1 Tax=Neobodo designis TaxID=312471 RepID=A0A7S1KXB8_NEODS